MFAQRTARIVQSLSNGMDGQRGTGEDSERTVDERQDSLWPPVVAIVVGRWYLELSEVHASSVRTVRKNIE